MLDEDQPSGLCNLKAELTLLGVGGGGGCVGEAGGGVTLQEWAASTRAERLTGEASLLLLP